MRIDSNAGAINGLRQVGEAGASAPAGKTADPGSREVAAPEAGGEQDTAQFLFDRVKTQALAPESPVQLQAARVRIDSLRRVLADGSYHVPSEVIAGSIVAEARVESR